MVRHIFRRFLELKSVPALRKELAAEGRVSKLWIAVTGTVRGGTPFENGALYHLLKNPTYLGKIRHKDKAHTSTHPPIIDQTMFDRVQVQLATRARRGPNSKRVDRSEGPAPLLSLKGRLFDCDGVAMTPAHAYGKAGSVHRYYVSSSVNRGRGERRPDGIYRLPALAAERWVIETLHRFAPDHDPLAILDRVEVHEASVQLALKASVLAPEERSLPVVLERISRVLQDGEGLDRADNRIWVHIPRRLKFRGGRAWLSGEAPKRCRLNVALIKGLKRGHDILAAQLGEDGVLHQSPDNGHDRTLIRLAWLAPDLQAAILEGRQKSGLCLEDLRCMGIPFCWDDQRMHLGG